MIVGGNLAILGVQIDAGAAIGEGKKLDATIDGIGSSAEAAEKKLAGLGDAAAEAGGELGAAGRGAKNAGNEIGGANQQAGRSQASFGGMALAAGAALVVIEGLGTAVSMFTNFLGDAIENSDRASAAVDRMTAASDTLKAATGDGLAPALESLAGILEEIASDPAAVETFQDIGAAVGTVVELVGEAIAAFREYQTFLGSEMVALNPFSGVSREEVEQLRIVLEMQRQLAQEAYQRRQADKAAAGETDKARQAMEKWVATLKRQGEERSRAAARAASERDREEKQLDSLIDKYDRQGGALRQLEREERVLMRALEDGRRPVEDLTKALEELRKKREELDGGISQKWVGTIDVDRAEKSFITDKQLDDADKLLDKTKDITVEARSAGEEFYAWANGLDMAAEALGGLNSDLGRTLSAAAGVVGMFGQMREMQSNGATRGEMALAGAEMGGQVFGLGQSLGTGWQGQRGKGKFGGKLSGDYADVGAMVGGAIGSIWGPVGAMVGSVIGGALGGAIKSGADEGVAKIRDAAGEAKVSISRNGGGLGTIVGGLGRDVVQLTEDITSSLGGELKGIAGIDIKVRDDIVSVIINGYAKRFEDVDQAISYAVGEALKRSEISGLDSMIAAGLQRADTSSLESLEKDMADINTVLGFGLGDAAMAARAMTAEIDVLTNSMMRLLGGTEELDRALSYIATEEARRWDDLRDRITGDSDSPAEIAAEREQDRLMFNAERALRIADLQARREELAAQLQLLQGQESLAEARIRISAYELDATAKIMDQEVKLLGQFSQAAAIATGVSIDTVRAQLAALDQLIAAMPPEIGKGDLKPLGGQGGGVGKFGNDFGRITGRWENMTQKWKDAQENLLDGLQRIALGESTTAFTGRERAMLAKSELDSLIGRARGGDVDAVGRLDDAFGDFAEIYKTFTGGGQGFLGDFRDVFSEYYEELQRIGTMERPSRTRTGNVVFDERFHRGQTEQLREQREHRRQAREDMRALTMAVHAGNKQQRELAAALRRNNPDTVQVRRRRAQP